MCFTVPPLFDSAIASIRAELDVVVAIACCSTGNFSNAPIPAIPHIMHCLQKGAKHSLQELTGGRAHPRKGKSTAAMPTHAVQSIQRAPMAKDAIEGATVASIKEARAKDLHSQVRGNLQQTSVELYLLLLLIHSTQLAIWPKRSIFILLEHHTSLCKTERLSPDAARPMHRELCSIIGKASTSNEV
eukprot:4138341-Amphidinium_carterae.1